MSRSTLMHSKLINIHFLHVFTVTKRLFLSKRNPKPQKVKYLHNTHGSQIFYQGSIFEDRIQHILFERVQAKKSKCIVTHIFTQEL